MNISLVVAYDKNRGIGANGDLPWGRSLPADLANFKKVTTGKSIIMGRKTFESIGGRPLSDRENIVISSKPTAVKGTLTAVNLSSALALARYEIFIIGGSRVYADALPHAKTIYATEVHAAFPGADTFFAQINDDWVEISRTHHPADGVNAHPFDFVVYRKKSEG